MTERREIALKIFLNMLSAAPTQQVKELVDLSVKSADYLIEKTSEDKKEEEAKEDVKS